MTKDMSPTCRQHDTPCLQMKAREDTTQYDLPAKLKSTLCVLKSKKKKKKKKVPSHWLRLVLKPTAPTWNLLKPKAQLKIQNLTTSV
jgi:hypothetical protein